MVRAYCVICKQPSRVRSVESRVTTDAGDGTARGKQLKVKGGWERYLIVCAECTGLG